MLTILLMILIGVTLMDTCPLRGASGSRALEALPETQTYG